MIKDTTKWLDGFRLLKHPSQVIAVCSGKGGVGKTSVSLRLAKELANYGKKVLLLDCDFNLSNTAIKLGIPLNDVFLKVVKSPEKLAQYVEKHHGFDLLPACSGDVEVLEARNLITRAVVDILSMHSHCYDIILLDAPAGATKESLNLIALADYRLFVITPEPSSITDGYSLFKLINERYGCSNNLLMINRYQSESQWQRVKKVMTETTLKYAKDSLHFVGELPQLEVNHSDFDQEFLLSSQSEFSAKFLNITHGINEIILANRLERYREENDEKYLRAHFNI